MSRVASSLEAIDIPHTRMSGIALRRVYPAFQVPDDYDVVFEPDAGMIAAARSVAVQVELARRLGGERTRIHEGTAVRRIDLEAKRPTVWTDDLKIEADRLIVTAGPWTGQLLPDLPFALRPTRQQVLYLRPPDPVAFAPGRFPIFIFMGGPGVGDFYGMPPFEGMGIKVARNGGPEFDPDAEDRAVIDDDYPEIVRRHLRAHLPALADAPIDFSEVCLYTMAPDDHFRLGSLPDCPEVIVASPCSGHGFKFSCLLGRVLADFACQGRTDLDIVAWRF